MKKLVLTAALFFAFTTAAFAQQTRNHDGPPKKPTTEQMMKRFDDLNLTNAQKKKLKALFQEREAKFEKNRPAKMEGNRSDRYAKGSENAEMKARMDKERKEFDKKIQKILTKDQYNKFKAKQPERVGMQKDKPKFEKNDKAKSEKWRG